MYNYYTYRKEKKKALTDLKKTRAKSCKEQQKEKLNAKLVQNYQEKLKDFILNMAKSTYKVRDYKSMNKTTRELFLDENAKKIRAHQTFRFSAFETDKERINKIIREKMIHNEPVDYESAKRLFKKQNEILLKRSAKIYYTLVQPKMKFRSTSDLERFIDSNACSSKQKEVFNKLKQKTLGGKNMGKDNNSGKMLHDELKRIILKKNRYNSFIIDKVANTKETINYKDRVFGLGKKKDTENKKDTPENIEEQVNMEYNIKTTFKGAMSLASKYSSPEEIEAKKKVFKKVKEMLSKSYNNMKYKQHKVIPNLASVNFRTKEKQANFKKVANKILEGNLLSQVSEAFPLNPKNFDIFSSNPFLYFIESEHLKQNEIQNEKQALMNDFNLQEKLNYIREIASRQVASVKKYKRERGDVNDAEKNMDMNVEEKIKVGDEEVSLGETNLIAKKMLQKCHYTNKKKIIRDGYEKDRKKYQEEQDQWLLRELERKKKMREEIIESNKDYYG